MLAVLTLAVFLLLAISMAWHAVEAARVPSEPWSVIRDSAATCYKHARASAIVCVHKR